MNRIIYIIIVLSGCFSGFSQDIHFSQFDYNPVFQNPGNVGQFNGTYRFHFNHRDQWRRVTVPFQTTSLSVDAKPFQNKKIALGLSLFHDVVGDGNLRTVEFMPSISYQFKIKQDTTHTLRPAVQFGINNRSLSFENYYFDAQFNGTAFDPTLPNNEILVNAQKTNVSIGIGGVYEWYKSKRKKITGGVGLFNLNRPNQGFFGTTVNRDIRMNVFVRAHYKIGIDLDIIPSFQFNAQGKYKELNFGAQLRYILKDKNGEYSALYGGLFFRNKDAAYVLAGLEWQNWWGGVSYDINVSELVPASNGRGGLEVSLRYILTPFKPRKIIHRVCPDYI
ncbi:MAG: PorP/SprF family type IX secretion system membrane protein [Lishizhenia sp.]